jgi:hypothetical protein
VELESRAPRNRSLIIRKVMDESACGVGRTDTQKRKLTEEPFGWAKTIGGLARPMLRGVARLTVQVHFDNGSLQPHPAAQVARASGRNQKIRIARTPIIDLVIDHDLVLGLL